MSQPKPETQAPVLDLRAAAFIAAAALAWTACGLVFAALAARQIVPNLAYAYRAEHAVAFYLVALLAAAGLPRASVRRQALSLVAVAVGLWAIRLLIPMRRPDGLVDFLCDIAGAAAALTPLWLGRRQRRAITP